MGNYLTVGPNELMVISGGCFRASKKQYISGGIGWAWWSCSDVKRLTLEVITLHPVCDAVLTSEGVPVHVNGICQVKVMKDDEFISRAVEQLMGRDKTDIGRIAQQTVEGHLRSILGSLTVEEIYQDRERFAAEVMKVAAPDVGRMGLEIVSFVLKDISDSVDYLAALGRSQTANVKRDAAIGVAQANRDAGIKEAVCENQMMETKYAVRTRIADAERACRLMEAGFDREVQTKSAEANLAYSLQTAKTEQQLTKEEMGIEIVGRTKDIEVLSQEVIRKQKELVGSVELTAEAEAYKVQRLAEGHRISVIAAAEANGEQVRRVGEAQAIVIKAKGNAEAERMRLRATTFEKYGDAAIVSIILRELPNIAGTVCSPLRNVKEIVMLGDDRTTSEVSKLISQLPPAIQALTGVDLSKVFAEIPGAQCSLSSPM